MPDDINLGVLELQILWLLGKQPQHGYSLMARLKALKKTEVKQGTLYPTMARLVRKGLAKSRREGSRIIYSLTPKGRRVLKANAAEMVRMLAGIIGDFYCKPKLCGRRGERECSG